MKLLIVAVTLIATVSGLALETAGCSKDEMFAACLTPALVTLQSRGVNFSPTTSDRSQLQSEIMITLVTELMTMDGQKVKGYCDIVHAASACMAEKVTRCLPQEADFVAGVFRSFSRWTANCDGADFVQKADKYLDCTKNKLPLNSRYTACLLSTMSRSNPFGSGFSEMRVEPFESLTRYLRRSRTAIDVKLTDACCSQKMSNECVTTAGNVAEACGEETANISKAFYNSFADAFDCAPRLENCQTPPGSYGSNAYSPLAGYQSRRFSREIRIGNGMGGHVAPADLMAASLAMLP